MYTACIKSMDLKQIAESGQCFRMRQLEGQTYSVITRQHYTEIAQDGQEFRFSCTEEEFHTVWYPYFDLSTDYEAIKQRSNGEDSYLTAAIQNGGGIRILNQDLWEMIITFLISQNNNITRITRSIDALCQQLGTPCTTENGAVFHSFPEAESIVSAGLCGLGTLGLGYRDKYIIKTAEHVVDGSFDLSALRYLTYEEAHKLLMNQYGIGKKVADCVCLFGLHHIDAFPIDTHIQKILDKHYPEGFPFGHYTGFLGIIQQYLFYYDLKGGQAHPR